MLIKLYLPILAKYIIYRKKMEEYKQVDIHLCHVNLRYKLELFKVITTKETSTKRYFDSKILISRI